MLSSEEFKSIRTPKFNFLFNTSANLEHGKALTGLNPFSLLTSETFHYKSKATQETAVLKRKAVNLALIHWFVLFSM